MRHAIDDFLHAILAAIFDDRFHRGDHRFPAVEPETLGADIFARQEFLPFLGLDHLAENRALAFLGEFDALVGALHPVLKETPFRSEEHTSELQSLMRISYAVFCLITKITHLRTPQ